eukprot:15461166-Alexandrium_andersonii.AAC.1
MTLFQTVTPTGPCPISTATRYQRCPSGTVPRTVSMVRTRIAANRPRGGRWFSAETCCRQGDHERQAHGR